MLNGLLVFVNLIDLAVGLLVGEYELAKLRTPGASWLVTPTTLDLIVVSLIALVTILNLAALTFVIRRHLIQHQRWLMWTTSLSLILVIVLGVVLGPRFWPILWP